MNREANDWHRESIKPRQNSYVRHRGTEAPQQIKTIVVSLLPAHRAGQLTKISHTPSPYSPGSGRRFKVPSRVLPRHQPFSTVGNAEGSTERHPTHPAAVFRKSHCLLHLPLTGGYVHSDPAPRSQRLPEFPMTQDTDHHATPRLRSDGKRKDPRISVKMQLPPPPSFLHRFGIRRSAITPNFNPLTHLFSPLAYHPHCQEPQYRIRSSDPRWAALLPGVLQISVSSQAEITGTLQQAKRKMRARPEYTLQAGAAGLL